MSDPDPEASVPGRGRRHPWVVVGGSGVLTGLGHGFVAFAVSALVKPLSEELGIGRGSVSSAIGMGRLVSGLAAPVAGAVADRYGPIRSVLLGLLLTALGFFLLRSIASLAGLVVVWGVLISAGASFAFTVALDKLVVSSLNQRRGLALATRLSLAGLVTTLLIPVVSWGLNAYGWRTVCLLWSLLMTAFIPLVWWLFGDRGGPSGPTVGAAGRSAGANRPAPVAPTAWWAIFQSPVYWVIAVGFMVLAGTNTGLTVHLVPMVTDLGHSAGLAAGALSSLVLLSIPARMAVGVWVDRLQKRTLFLVFAGLMVAESLTLFWFATSASFPSLLAALLMLSIATGATTLVVLVLVSRLFGVERFGFLQGSLMFFQIPGTAVAPILLGLVYDQTGSYTLAITALAAALALVSLPVFWAARHH